jgi:hypothetical protein
MYMALEKHHSLANESPSPGWTKWKPATWCGQRDPEDRQKFAAWCGPNLVGFLNVRADYPSIFSSGEKVLYVEHVGSAPGNLSTEIWEKRLAGIGTALMAYAVLQSVLQGYEARVGLHASDSTADGFYLTLNQKRPIFHPGRQGVGGTPQDRRAPQRPYYETVPEQALHLLEDYRRA